MEHNGKSRNLTVNSGIKLDYLPVPKLEFLPVPKLDYLPVPKVGLSSRPQSWIIFPSENLTIFLSAISAPIGPIGGRAGGPYRPLQLYRPCRPYRPLYRRAGGRERERERQRYTYRTYNTCAWTLNRMASHKTLRFRGCAHAADPYNTEHIVNKFDLGGFRSQE